MKIVADEEIKNLKQMIYLAPDANDRAKRILFALIDASEKLKKPVFLASEESLEIYTGIHNIINFTDINDSLSLIGVNLSFSYSYTGTKEMYDNTIQLVDRFRTNISTEINKELVDRINLKNYF